MVRLSDDMEFHENCFTNLENNSSIMIIIVFENLSFACKISGCSNLKKIVGLYDQVVAKGKSKIGSKTVK